MHSYSSCFNYTSHLHLLIAGLSLGVFYLLSLIPFPWFQSLSPLIVLTIFGGLELVFDRWLWRPLSWIEALSIYDFTGTYKGQLRPGNGQVGEATVTIRQTWSHISIDFDSGADAKSYSASIIKDRRQNGSVELIYNYFASGERQGDGTRFNHYGTAILNLSKDKKTLTGEYYTEQSRDTFGQLVLERVL